MSSSSFMPADISALLGANTTNKVENSTSRKGNTELNMEDFLQLMIVQLQNQTIDDTMDTSEMMNQMVQMQMVTALANMTDASVMGYASSLVGKTVTIGIPNGSTLEEREVEVIGTGMMNGQQVIFGKDDKDNVETYSLNQIMAIGKLPPIKKDEEADEPGDGTGKPVEGAGKPSGGTEGSGKPEGGETTPPVDQSGENQGTQASPQYQGEQGAPTD